MRLALLKWRPESLDLKKGLFFLVFVVLGLASSVQATNTELDLSNPSDLQKTSNEQLCSHPVYPCYYFVCNNAGKLGMDLEKLKTFRCPKGLIFDDKLQRCSWVLPWKSCLALDEAMPASTVAINQNFSKKTASPLLVSASPSSTSTTTASSSTKKATSASTSTKPSTTVKSKAPSKTKTKSFQSKKSLSTLNFQQGNSLKSLRLDSLLANPGSQRMLGDSYNNQALQNQLIKLLESSFSKVMPQTLSTLNLPQTSLSSSSSSENDLTSYALISKSNPPTTTPPVATQPSQVPQRVRVEEILELSRNSPASPKLAYLDHTDFKQKQQSLPSKQDAPATTPKPEYDGGDFNVTIDRNYKPYDEDEIEQIEQEEQRYAYIIVPVKVSKTRRLPDLLRKKQNSKSPSKTKQKRPTNATKNFQDIFRYKKVCYITNWSQYREKPGHFVPEHVDPFLCTHLIYAFAYIDNETLTIRTIEENDEEMYRRINDLKFKNPKLKTMLGIGGWNMESREFSAMVREKKSRQEFINHAIKFLRQYGFDGLDLDWEFPGDVHRGGSVDDKPNFTFLVNELRKAIDEEPLEENREPLVLSAAVAAGKKRIEAGYEVSKIVNDLDFINLMSFDFHGSWDGRTGLNAPLYSNENETNENIEYNQDWSVNYWLKNGCPPHKLILGLPAFGRTFHLKNEKENGLAARSFKNGTSGNFTKTPGFLAFYEICELRKNYNWTVKWHAQSKSHYMYRNNDWISYDDIKSYHLRTAYVVAKKLGGIFIWSIDMDDFSGKFCDLGAYPLIKNSMSLLMDFMPEYYSSNVNQPPIQLKRQQYAQKRKQHVPQNIFYILKDDHLTNLNTLTSLPSISPSGTSLASSPSISAGTKSFSNGINVAGRSNVLSTSAEEDFDLAKQNRIRNDLVSLLTLQPQKFVSFSLPDTFNCTNKHTGLHRDPFDCQKYYYCENNSPLLKDNGLIQTKAYICPENSIFNMKGCFCDKELAKDENCNYLADTYCDFGLLRTVPKKFA